MALSVNWWILLQSMITKYVNVVCWCFCFLWHICLLKIFYIPALLVIDFYLRAFHQGKYSLLNWVSKFR